MRGRVLALRYGRASDADAAMIRPVRLLPVVQGCIRRDRTSQAAPEAVGWALRVVKAVGGGRCRLQMPLRPALAVRGTVAGHRLGALEGGGEGGRLPTPPSVPLHRHCTPQDVPTPPRLSDPTGGSPTPSGAAGVPEASSGTASARRGSGTQRANPGAPAAQHRLSPVPGGSSTQLAATGVPAWHCGKEWWSRKGKEPQTKPGWADPRTTQAHAPPASTIMERTPPATTKERVMRTRDPRSGGAQGVDGKALGGVGHLGLTHTETWEGRWWTTAGRRSVGSENRQTTPAPTSTTPVHQLLGTANAQTAPAATSTAPAHQ